MKKGVIYQYHQEIESWKERGSILIRFHRESIALFYQENQKDLDSIFEELIALQQEALVFEDGKMIIGENNQGVFKEGWDIKKFEDTWM